MALNCSQNRAGVQKGAGPVTMKVLLVNKFFYKKGGSETSFFETADLLASKGHKPVFFSMHHPENEPSEYADCFVEEVDYARADMRHRLKYSGNILYSREARKNIETIILNEKPDIAHLHNIHHQLSPSILHSFKKYDIPVVWTLHDYKIVCASYSMLAGGAVCEDCRGGAYMQCLRRKCVKGSRSKSMLNTLEMYLHNNLLDIYRLVDVFISPSRFLKETFHAMGFKYEIKLLHYFIDLKKHEPSYEGRQNTIVYFGRLSREKGVETLLQAVKGLDVQLNVAGDGPLKEDLRATAERESIKNAHFLGYLQGEALQKILREAMIIVVPSEWYENYPFAVMEAFAMGKPVVGSRIGGIPEMVVDRKTGLTFTPGNVGELRAALEELLGNPDAVAAMGKNARAFVETELNAETHYEKLMAVYREALR